MRGLLLRLSALDPNAESAVRVIEFFDRLVENRASVQALVRAAANLAECPAGFRDPHGGAAVRFDEHGRPLSGALGVASLEREFGSTSDERGTVWLERPALPSALDELLLERMAVAADVIWDRMDRGRPRALGGEELLPLLLGGRASERDARRAAELLGFPRDQELTVAAIRVPKSVAETARGLGAAAGRVGGSLVRGGVVEGEIALVSASPLTPNGIGGTLEGSAFAGLGTPRPPARCAESWEQARTALRFARAGGRGAVVAYADLGPLALLAQIPTGESMREPDVAAVGRLMATETGREELAAVVSVCRTGSLRRAAVDLHLHHSSLSHRVRKAEQALGYSLETPESLSRAQLAVQLWRLGHLED
ncbi:helix-turn-helix domain-containing protein [Embleya hyalina]|uniref:PucR C-terminal helix-turn-helix domain-containing protein n=1 Tax=Embleya hyalina TaxID=516124 RepID=A0A401Z5T0_9ACTN|nr:helix-turn-helix domain-containing protein [Embleya hyalina]GCE02220.1 hypothetical protein EHYA_09997 [Embleya hyalina]